MMAKKIKVLNKTTNQVTIMLEQVSEVLFRMDPDNYEIVERYKDVKIEVEPNGTSPKTESKPLKREVKTSKDSKKVITAEVKKPAKKVAKKTVTKKK